MPAGDDGTAFLWYWLAVAALNIALIGGVIAVGTRRVTDPFARRHALQVVGQFVPCLVAGAAVSLTLPALDPGLARLLPGLWALLLGLGVFASRPTWLVPRAGWPSSSSSRAPRLLAFPTADLARLGAVHGTVFGAGLLAAAVVLHLDLPRGDRG